MKNKELATEIKDFLDKYAGLKPKASESDENEYTSPDAYSLLACAELLEKNIQPTRLWSDWGSGGYRPYSDKVGQKMHEKITQNIYRIIKMSADEFARFIVSHPKPRR